MTVLEWVNEKLREAQEEVRAIGLGGTVREWNRMAHLGSRIEVLLEVKVKLEQGAMARAETAVAATALATYRICKHCDHFADENDSTGDGLAPYIHLEDGEQEFDHDAEPCGPAMSLEWWQWERPDLFAEHPDGRIGPNSSFHSRRGKL